MRAAPDRVHLLVTYWSFNYANMREQHMLLVVMLVFGVLTLMHDHRKLWVNWQWAASPSERARGREGERAASPDNMRKQVLRRVSNVKATVRIPLTLERGARGVILTRHSWHLFAHNTVCGAA